MKRWRGVWVAMALVAASCATAGERRKADNGDEGEGYHRIPGIFLEEPDETLERWVPSADQPVLVMGDDGLDVTTHYEGFEARPYDDPVGYCTIGYGHLIKRAPCDGTEPSEWQRPGLSSEDGRSLLREDMGIAEKAVMRYVETPLTQGQFDALCDFVFNVGTGNFRESTLLKEINAGRLEEGPTQLRRWVKAGGKTLKGLVDRREAEIGLYSVGMPETRGVEMAGEEPEPIDLDVGER